jgi:hypothetical protein
VVIRDCNLLLTGSRNQVIKWMHSYRLKAVENYKDAFKLIYITEMDHFDSHLYFYCVDNRINPLTISVDLNKVPLIAEEGRSHTKLPKEL